MTAAMLLSTYLDRYSKQQGLAERSKDQITITIRLYGRFLQSDPTLADLNDERVNDWLAVRAETQSPVTVKNNRRNLICLWRAAYDSRLITNRPERVRKVRCPQHPPRAWSEQQVQSLLKACRYTTGKLLGEIPQPLYWKLFVNITWDTALRCGDVLNLRLSDIGSDGLVVISQRKTGWEHICQLSPGTVDLLKQTLPTHRQLAIPWPYSIEFFRWQFNKIVKLAGIPRGTSKWLRRSSATALEALHPGSAMAHLGHRTPGIAYRNYVDPRLLQHSRPTVTPLCVPPDYTPKLVTFVPDPPAPIAPTHYGVPIIDAEVLEKLNHGERIGGREIAAMLRHLGITKKLMAEQLGVNVKHLGQILRGNVAMTQQLERKIRQRLYSHMAEAGIGGAA